MNVFKMVFVGAFLLGLLLFASLEVHAAPILYASTGNSNSNGGGRIYAIDPASQVVTLIGDTGLDRLGGLAFNGSGVLYTVSGGSGGPPNLYTVNTANGSASFVGTISGVLGVDALAFSASDVLFGGGWDGTSGRLLTIDPATGNTLTNIAMIGSGNSFVAGLAFDPANQLFGSRGDAFGKTEDLVEIDILTGLHTPIGLDTDVISDIWFAANGVLYGGSPTGDLFTIDPLTGDKTFLFNTGIRISGLTGLDPQPQGEAEAVPEPTSAAIFGIVLVAIAGYSLRHRSATRQLAS